MPSNSAPTAPADTAGVDVPSAVHAAARRYWRRTLALRGLIALGYFVVAVGLLFTLPFLPALAVIAVLLGTLAAPIFKSGGRIELTTDRDADAVADDFGSATPPVLGFQAALADDIQPTETGVVYDFSTLFGLRSATMHVETERFAADTTDGGDDADSGADGEIVVTIDDEPWGRYQVTIAERDGATAVTITLNPERRFGVRRLPDFVFGRRYRRALFEGQGYTLVADDTSLSV